jgi:hypothetical protein
VPFFKYMGEYASHKFLEEQTVRFCPPSEYNDPFELAPEIRLKEELSQSNINISISLVGGKPNFEAYEIPKSELLDYQYYTNTDLLVMINNAIGSSCFSYSTTSIPVNLLMWAHYAESHKGISIQLKESSPLINELSPVVYRKSRPIIDGRFLSENGIICMKDLYIKSEHWAYESEYRLSKRFNDCNEVSAGIFVSKIPAEHIERVVLGVNASQKLRAKALHFHKQHRVQVILTKRAKSGFGFEPSAVFGAEYSDAVTLNEWYKYESAQT